MHRRLAAGLAGTALVFAAAVPATAPAQDYPAAGKPGVAQKKPKGPFRTLKVCKKGCAYKKVGKAVKAARPGDTVKIGRGTYREGVQLAGKGKRYIKIIGDPAKPSSVVFDGKGLKGPASQNAILVNGADGVTIRGITAKHYKANGFFVVNVDGYTLRDLNATLTGVYGIYAFNSTGGTMRDSEASWNNDGGFYIGQTPKQAKPKRSVVTNVRAYGNVIGFSGTNMRYVTITKSEFFNNGTGIVPNALTSEKFPPAENNVIADNDVFWNNFNYYRGAPFALRDSAGESTPYPVGVGILLFGSRNTRVENNRVYGNWLGGAGMVQQFLLKDESAKDLIGNSITGNVFGVGGTDPNGRDILYDGNGSGNCVGNNTGVQRTMPENGSTFAPCPFTGANAFDPAVQSELVNYALDETHEKYWITGPHAAKPGYQPLVRYADYAGPKPR